MLWCMSLTQRTERGSVKVVHLALFVQLELAPPTRLTTRHSAKQCHKHRRPRLRLLARSYSYAYGHNMGLFNYYAFGLPSFVVLVIALYLLFTGTSHITRSRFGVGLKVGSDALRQTLEKHSMSEGSWRSQVLMRGRALVSGCVLGSVCLVPDGTSSHLYDMCSGAKRTVGDGLAGVSS